MKVKLIVDMPVSDLAKMICRECIGKLNYALVTGSHFEGCVKCETRLKEEGISFELESKKNGDGSDAG